MADPRLTSMMQPYSAASQVLARGARSRPAPQARAVEGLVNPEVWTMFDTLIIGAAAVPPATAAVNFAQITANTAFFASRTIGNAGAAISSMTTSSGYVDFPFKAYGIGVDVWCAHEAVNTGFSAGGAPPMSTAVAFCEAVIQGGALTLQFATDYKFIAPISDLPAGGGMVIGSFTDTRALAAVQVSGSANNGLASVQARALWKDYILFRGKDQPFTVNLVLNPQALLRINNLAALTAVASVPAYAGIRVKFWGYRGKSLVVGSPFRG